MHPPNFKLVKRQNPAFQKRLGGLVGGHDCMLAVGFKVELDAGAEVYQLHASPEQWPKLVQAKTEVEQAVAQAKQQQQAMSAGGGNMFAPPNNNTNPLGAGMGGSMPGMDPMMQQQMTQMLSNPEALRTAMQVSLLMLRVQCVRMSSTFLTPSFLLSRTEPHDARNDTQQSQYYSTNAIAVRNDRQQSSNDWPNCAANAKSRRHGANASHDECQRWSRWAWRRYAGDWCYESWNLWGASAASRRDCAKRQSACSR